MADYLSRNDFILDELGYLPFAQSGGREIGANAAMSD